MERFTNTAFFPNYEEKGSGLLESIQTQSPVFSFDMNGVGAKHFFSCGYESFVGHYETKVTCSHMPPNYYEVLQFDLPSKLYFDFDASGMDIEQFKDIVNDFLNHFTH